MTTTVQQAPSPDLIAIEPSHRLPITLEIATPEELLDSFLNARSGRTNKAYKQDLESFREWLNVDSIDDAAKILLSAGQGPANGLALKYQTHLRDKGLQPSTINRRLTALKSLVKQANTLGLVNWHLSVSSLKSESYRDTAGPGLSNFRRMLSITRSRTDTKGIRDTAIITLLYSLALRRSELVELELAHVDLESRRISIKGKGKTQRTKLTLPEPVVTSLEAWLNVRGTEEGPLFYSVDKGGRFQGRLKGNGLYRIIRRLGKDIGVETRPHGLRHTAITQCCQLAQAANLDLTSVLQFSRHSSLSVLQVYLDKEKDLQGQLATLVAIGAEG